MLSMGNAVFRGPVALKLLDRFSQNCMQISRPIWSKGAWLRMREVVAVNGVCFFFFTFLTFMRNTTGPPAGPINVINGSNDVPHWSYIPYMVLIISTPFSPPKFENLHCGLCTLRTAITQTRSKIEPRCLHHRGGFRGRAI